MRIGKTIFELDKEFETIIDCFKVARKDFLRSTSTNLNADEKVISMINQWKYFVYDDIAKKTGEIKSVVQYKGNGKYFKIGHEIEGWRDLEILKKFCEYASIPFDVLFYQNIKRKIENISSLTVFIYIEIYDENPSPQFHIGVNIIKPEDKVALNEFLDGSIEKGNLFTWFNANHPVPLEFGMSIGDFDSEFIIGFYIFDSSPQTNLSKALTALQAYGAQIDKHNIDTFKTIPGEELKVYFEANMYGVQRVKLVMMRNPHEADMAGLLKLDKKFDQNVWNLYESAFEPITMKKYFVLQFSSDGFEYLCKREVGSEIGSKVYVDDLN